MADPLYRQIAQDLQRKIESGELAPGDKLPSELEVREEYVASRNTIRDAIKWLTVRGLVESGRPSPCSRGPPPVRDQLRQGSRGARCASTRSVTLSWDNRLSVA